MIDINDEEEVFDYILEMENHIQTENEDVEVIEHRFGVRVISLHDRFVVCYGQFDPDNDTIKQIKADRQSYKEHIREISH